MSKYYTRKEQKKMNNPFTELSNDIDCEQSEIETPEESSRKSSFYVATVQHVFSTKKELKAYLANSDDFTSTIIRGSELVPQKKVIYDI
jgi:hypothetical protein